MEPGSLVYMASLAQVSACSATPHGAAVRLLLAACSILRQEWSTSVVQWFSLFLLCGSQILKRTMNRASLVSFLGNTEKERTMGVDMTRVFCYSVLQLTFQV